MGRRPGSVLFTAQKAIILGCVQLAVLNNRDSVAGKDATDPTCLALDIQNMGPISCGNIRIKPLTVLVGPNGCGKSHVSTLVHSVIDAERLTTNEEPAEMSEPGRLSAQITGESLRIYQQYVMGKTNNIDSNIFQIVAKSKIDGLTAILIRNFATNQNLIRIGSKRFRLRIESRTVRCDLEYSGTFKSTTIGPIKLHIVFDENVPCSEFAPAASSSKNDTALLLTTPNPSGASDIYSVLNDTINRFPTGKRIGRSVYFPAERAGLSLLHKSLILNYHARLIDRRHMPNSVLAGVATEFLSVMTTLKGNKSEFFDLVRKFEDKALGGIIYARRNPNSTPDIYFRKEKRNFPLHTGASSIKDLAVFLAYLKYSAVAGDLIILEEPETCLHPNNQRLLAVLIAQLVKAGLYMLVTTHSPYLLEQLSHCVMAGGINETQRADELSAEASLHYNHVSAYRFEADDGGYKILPIEVTDSGIPQTDFVKVDEALYSELNDIRRADKWVQ